MAVRFESISEEDDGDLPDSKPQVADRARRVTTAVADDDGYDGKVHRKQCKQITFTAQSGMAGLENLGNTCFMNAGLQCLSHVEPFAAFFLSGRYEEEINLTNKLGCKGELAKTFAELQTSLWTGNRGIQNPKELHKKLSTFAPHLFEGFEQQDVQEFLAFCLDGLHEDLNRARQEDQEPKGESEEEVDENEGNELAAAVAWMRHLERDKSFLVDLFQGQLRSSLTCTRCGNKSMRFDPFMYLSLPVTFEMKNIGDAVEKYLEEETLTAPDQWHCDKCKLRVDAVKKIDLWHLPPVLVIHLKRFEYDAIKNKFRKIGNLLAASSPIDFSPYCSTKQKGGALYDVTCVANHQGGFGSGHYTATCRVGDRFFKFDDTSVTAIADDADPVNPNAYVLFLVHRTGSGSFDKGHRSPVVHRQTVRMPELWPQRLSSVISEDSLKRINSGIKKARNGSNLSEAISSIRSDDSSYTLTLPDVDSAALAAYRTEPSKQASETKTESGGCVATILKILCGIK